MSVCRSCGAPIVWIAMESGKSMPCDAALVPFWEKPKARGKVVTQDGRLRKGKSEIRSPQLIKKLLGGRCVFAAPAERAKVLKSEVDNEI